MTVSLDAKPLAERQAELEAAFAARFGAPPAYVVRAPGRVNLIGEHTDYHEGFVLPAAIDREVLIAGSPKADREDFGARLVALDFEGQEDAFSVARPEQLKANPERPWADLPRGMLVQWGGCAFKRRGFDAMISANLPIGGGLSSSAATTVAFGTFLDAMVATGVPPRLLAKMAQRAEQQFLGVQVGLMDQLASACGRAGAALLLDCRSLATRPVALRLEEAGLRLLVVHSGVPRQLSGSKYNERREEAEAALAEVRGLLPKLELKTLRDVEPEALAAIEAKLSPMARRRAGHVVGENDRVLAAVEAISGGKWKALGKLMKASHESLRDAYEVSHPAVDELVKLSAKAPGVVGARLTGAGFGGCVVVLVEVAQEAAYLDQVLSAYTSATGLTPSPMRVHPSEGASVLKRPG